MTDFQIHDLDTAPEKSKPLLEGSLKGLGFIPNLHGVMAESPAHLQAYQTLHGLFQQTSLSTVEQNVVWLTINVRHNCHYCVPAHTVIAEGAGVPAEVITALRDETPIPDARLEALRTFTLAVTDKRGEVSQIDLDAFFDAGFTREHVLDVILGLAQKVMSNYVNHVAQTRVDAAFAGKAWTKAAANDAA